MKYILVAEDNDFNYFLIETLLLSENKYVVVRAENGLEAINCLRTRNNISLVLMDIQMPVMDGLTATKEIRKINKEIPIIIQTSLVFDKIKEKAFESGCTDFITKPVTVDLLIPKIEGYQYFYF